jgi:FdhD protein
MRQSSSAPHEGEASQVVSASRFSYETGPGESDFDRPIAVEAPVQFVIGGAPHAVMMATPQDLEDFAYGFLFTEGVASPKDIRGVEIDRAPEGWRISVAVSGAKLKTHLARKRAMAGRTGCGLCGVEDFAGIPTPPAIPPGPQIMPPAIGAALAELEKLQPINSLTRSVHAAAWVGERGDIRLVREDVGRHNALDKAIGALLREGVAPASGFFLITSRCSFEMVVKAALFGAGTLVSVSAPTSLALEKAHALGITVIAVARLDSALSFGAPGAAGGGMAA